MISMWASSISTRQTTEQMICRMPARSRPASPAVTLAEKSSRRLMRSERSRSFSATSTAAVPEAGKALFQASDTRFEFRLVDDAFGIAVDQPADAATQGGHLSFQADDLIRLADFVAGLAEAAAIFVGPRRWSSRRPFT